MSTVVDQQVVKVALVATGLMLPAISFVLGPSMVSEIAPTSQRGTALLVTYSIITVAGLLSPVVAGYAVQRAAPDAVAGYEHVFLITSVILILAGAGGFVLLHPETTIRRFRGLAADSILLEKLSSRTA